ncbi:MAG: protein of unknown function transrane [Bacteroidetes bacterium]|uniref:DMT family transporter n=1 Tax=[Flexibacter] sp. ATCC 35208 TaxID=1936242 RepID=UPI0009CF017C|nr:DMT family transporter [[Flexibacter] sp. ATCC 35208]MBP1650741.1 protein of unknown function transrane [Bacteroidota bacterium]OMP79490.1 hypothetical protein BW716_09005 [[Flexibacter] sp. ATCC 35208]
MSQRTLNWGIFLLLSLTWGSSFILMKLGMEQLSPWQVASLRMLCAGISLSPFFFRFIHQMPVKKLPLIFLSGLLGNFIPAFLFCIAEMQVDSGLAGILNGFTPLMTLVTGVLLFNNAIIKRQLLGISAGLIGVVLLFASQGISTSYWYYGLWILVATVCYGTNINLVRRHLKDYSSVQVSAISLGFCAILALPVLLYTHFFALLNGPAVPWTSIGAAATLGILGSGIATVLFYFLISRTGAMFASMVTYALPIVALGWGFLAGEHITVLQILSLGIILGGVYLVNRK